MLPLPPPLRGQESNWILSPRLSLELPTNSWKPKEFEEERFQVVFLMVVNDFNYGYFSGLAAEQMFITFIQ